MWLFFRSLLFRFRPETAHHFTLQWIRLGAYQPIRGILEAIFAAPEKPVEAFGLKFRNPVGLAAGYDKDGTAWRGLAALGFGHIEIGTVTPLPQPGNPEPRLFRLVEDEALINRMGFPGQGAQVLARRLQRFPASKGKKTPVLGINLGKNAATPLEEAERDYVSLVRTFTPCADYLAINVSSPNTLGLRQLQGRRLLERLLAAVAGERSRLVAAGAHRVPILVKLAPDLTESELEDALDVILRSEMDGVIATNTTLSRENVSSPLGSESGGLSGLPLRARSFEMLQWVIKKTGGKLPVVSVGGISTSQEAKSRLDAGAALVQIYTGLVYQGPGLVKKILAL